MVTLKYRDSKGKLVTKSIEFKDMSLAIEMILSTGVSKVAVHNVVTAQEES